MKILKQLAIIFAICLVGELIGITLPFPVPSSVISLTLVAILLISKLLKERQIKGVADFFLANMGIVFVPAGIGIVEELHFLKGKEILVAIVLLISLVITFLGTCGTVILIKFLLEKRKRKPNL